MPSKSRRAASRQSQLKRKRRGQSRPQEFDAGPTESSQRVVMDDAAEEAGVETAIAAPVAGVSQSPARRVQRSRRQAASETPLTYNYLGSEVRRTAVITGLIAIVLVVMTFVLGG